jgi:hypothetical protein
MTVSLKLMIRRLAELGSPIFRISIKHEGSGTASITSDGAGNLSDALYVCIGARVMLTKNLRVENGLVKGPMCQNSHGQDPRIPGPKTLDGTNSAKRPR